MFSIFKNKKTGAQKAFDRILKSGLYGGDPNLPMMDLLKLFGHTLPIDWHTEATASLDTIIRVFPGALNEHDVIVHPILYKHLNISSLEEMFQNFDRLTEWVVDHLEVEMRSKALPIRYEPVWRAHLECGARVIITDDWKKIICVDQQAKPDASLDRRIKPSRILVMERVLMNPTREHGYDSWESVDHLRKIHAARAEYNEAIDDVCKN